MSDIDNLTSVKYTNIFSSPTQYQQILGNNENCPVYYCNYEKASIENRKILQRNIPLHHRPLKVPSRNGYTVCKKYIDLNKSQTERYSDPFLNKSPSKEHFTSNYNNTSVKVDNYDQDLLDNFYKQHKSNKFKKNKLHVYDDSDVNNWNHIGRAWAENEISELNDRNNDDEISPWNTVEKNIDIDSELKQGFLHSECPDKRYKPKLCDTVHVNTPELLENPYCQNYKVYDFNDHTQPYCGSNKSVSKNTNKMHRNFNEISDENILEFNYNNQFPTCFSSNLKSKSSISNIKNPVLFNEISNNNANYLGTGPERIDHKYENIWNNYTKRRLI